MGANRVLQRVDGADMAIGIARLGVEEAAPIKVRPFDGVRPMYEVFGARTYSVLDGEARVATVHGPMRVEELADAVWRGEEIHVEEFSGKREIQPWHSRWFRTSPHLPYLPTAIGEQVLSSLLQGQASELTVPRAVFAELNWLLRRPRHDRSAPLGLVVDNKTFPTEVTIAPSAERGNKVIAVTKWEESQPWELSCNVPAWRLVCDGLIVG